MSHLTYAIVLLTACMAAMPPNVPSSKSDSAASAPKVAAPAEVQTFAMTWRAAPADKRRTTEIGSRRVYEIALVGRRSFDAEDTSVVNAPYGEITFADAGKTSFLCGLAKGSPRGNEDDLFFIDLNHNDRLEPEEFLKGKPVHKGLSAVEYGAVDLTLQGIAGPRTHRVFVHLNSFGPLYLASHCYTQGRISLGPHQVEAIVVDYNCDGRYAAGKMTEKSIGSLGPRELDYDVIGWDVTT